MGTMGNNNTIEPLSKVFRKGVGAPHRGVGVYKYVKMCAKMAHWRTGALAHITQSGAQNGAQSAEILQSDWLIIRGLALV